MKINKFFLHIWSLALVLILTSCNSNLDESNPTSKTYSLLGKEWKSTSKTHFSNDIYYRATEVPLAYYVLKDNPENAAKLDSILVSNQKERVIEFEFEHFNEKDLLKSSFTNLDYDKSVTYIANTIQKDFMAVTSSNDTIPCAGVLLERNFNIAPFKRVMLYFGNVPPEESIQLIYNDALFNNGIFKFKFEKIPFKT